MGGIVQACRSGAEGSYPARLRHRDNGRSGGRARAERGGGNSAAACRPTDLVIEGQPASAIERIGSLHFPAQTLERLRRVLNIWHMGKLTQIRQELFRTAQEVSQGFGLFRRAAQQERINPPFTFGQLLGAADILAGLPLLR